MESPVWMSAPAELSLALSETLGTSESVLWVGRPAAFRLACRNQPGIWAAAPLAVYGAHKMRVAASMLPQDRPIGLKLVMLAPWLLMLGGGIAFFVHWVWEYVRARRCFYILTHQRALIFRGRGNHWNLRAFPASRTAELRFKRRRNGSGDVRFAIDQEEVIETSGPELYPHREIHYRDVGFMALPNIDEVQKLIEEHWGVPPRARRPC